MIVDPVKAFRWLKYAKEENIQQSGIDVRINRVWKIIGPCEIDNSKKSCNKKELFLKKGLWVLEPETYDFECIEYVQVPDNCCALLIQRSSLNRLGTFITTGLYDNSFRNYIGGILHVTNRLQIKWETRVAQIVFIKSESKRTYKGQYNG